MTEISISHTNCAFVDKHTAGRLVGLSPETLKKLRRSQILKEGVHYVRSGKRLVRYNRELLLDWFINRENDPQAHDRAILNFLAALPSNQKKSGRMASSSRK